MTQDTDPLDPPGTHVDAAAAEWAPGQKRAALIAAGLLTLASLWIVSPFLPALGWAVIVGVSLWPLHERARSATPGWRHDLVPALTTLLVALAFVIPLVAVLRLALRDWVEVSQYLQIANVTGIPVPAALAHLPFGDRLVALWQANLAQPGVFGRLSAQGSAVAGRLGGGGHLLGLVVHRVVLIGFMLLVLFFLLRDGGRVADALRIGARRTFGPSGEHVGEQMVRAIRGTVNGLVIVGLGEGVIMGLAYEVAGVPHPALLGLLTGLLSVVPLGSMLAIVVAAGLVAAGGGTVAAIVVFAIGAVVVFVADHFVRPVLIGGSTRLPFVWVLLGILGGIETVGLIGLVLGPALMAAVLLLWREWTGQIAGPLNPIGSDA
ncbi:AI-2E family transporter [Novosphingobium sp.]|uniref:AI-2E family transporter n=1 Tax=Novosphingobium sp. TaxID=1874826 RepID=UPI0025E40CC2|nr:AI-2E family transporter [Novosphingobium sp.]